MLRRTNSQNKWEMYLNTRWLCLSSTVRYTKIKAPSWQMKITGAWKATNTPWVLISNKDHSCTVQIISKMIILQNTIRSECWTNSNRNKSNNYRDKMISFLNPIRIWSSDFHSMSQWFNRWLRRLRTCSFCYQKPAATCWNKNLRSLINSISSKTLNFPTIMKPYRTR